jgi:Ran GTPase-activating protein (RanGAP) involved in mRNA processing and transport
MQMSNRNITDSDILAHIGAIKHFPLLSSIELRNNRITSLSCKLIGSNLAHLSKVDIRGNKVGDNGVCIIAKNIRGMKEFYICETDATDHSVDVIIENLKCLTLLWAENNKITFKAAEKIINHQSLKTIGLQGNQLTAEDIASLKSSYRIGYLSI